MKPTPLILPLLALGLGACAATPNPVVSGGETTEAAPATAPEAAPPAWSHVPNPYFAAIAEADDPEQKDRLAILGMQGEYRVNFDFVETVELQAGYERKDDKDSGGWETVIVVEDEPGHIVLQHILVAPSGFVTKHWRQDWTFEADERFEFVADQTWRSEPLTPETRKGTWTQCVYEVSDAPRYCGTGTWNHDEGVSTWTSDRSWRPLPRREYTTRDDYNALEVVNRHTITPQGWTHEQDNTKVIRDGEETTEWLVREFGFNDYRSIEGFDFSPAYDYWDRTADYWAKVRDAWTGRLADGRTLTLNTPIDGMVIIMGTFEQADQAPDTSAEEERRAIEALLDQWTSVAGNTLETASSAP